MTVPSRTVSIKFVVARSPLHPLPRPAFILAPLLICLLALHCGGCASSAPVPPPTRTTSATAEVDAARSLYFDSDKAAAMARIAARPDLTPDEQSYIVSGGIAYLNFEDNRERVAVALIANPSFSEPAKITLLKAIPTRFSYDSTRKRLLDMINKRGSLTPKR